MWRYAVSTCIVTQIVRRAIFVVIYLAVLVFEGFTSIVSFPSVENIFFSCSDCAKSSMWNQLTVSLNPVLFLHFIFDNLCIFDYISMDCQTI